MDDIRAVMDAAGSRRAALFGWIDGAPLSLVFAATYPQRVVSSTVKVSSPAPASHSKTAAGMSFTVSQANGTSTQQGHRVSASGRPCETLQARLESAP